MPGAGSIPRQDPAPCWRRRIRPVQRRGGRLAARSEQRSRCTVLQITAEACPAICTPSPARVFVLCSAPVPAASLQNPLPLFGTPPSMSLMCPDRVWPLPGWAGTKDASPTHPKYILGSLHGSGAGWGCPSRDAEQGTGSTQAVLEAPQASGPVTPLRITSLMLMDFSLMPQIKVIGLGWPMDSAQVGRGGSARAGIDPAHPSCACMPWAAPHPALPLSALSSAFWFRQTPKSCPEIHLSLS